VKLCDLREIRILLDFWATYGQHAYPKSSMPHPNLVPPLPQDLQNRSFKGQDCQGWDFSGRDIRGCDFRKSNLRDADFTGVHTGRTQQQIKREKIGIPIGLILGVVFGVVMMTAYKSPTVFSYESSNAALRMGMFTIVTALAFMFIAIATFVWLRLSAGMIAMTGAMSIAPLSVPIFNLINSPLNALPIRVVIFIVGAVFSSGAGVFYYRLTVKLFHNAIGTDFQGANLSGANFTNAILKNCAFKQANLSQANWSNVETSRCDRDVTKLA
jgi:Pentapeptide repeats (8 copies)